MYSMTGFGRGTAAWGDRVIVIEIKTVNHRYLETRIRASKEMLAAEAAIDQRVRRALGRGYCTVSMEVEGASLGTMSLDTTALRRYLVELRDVATQAGLELRDLTPVLALATDVFSSSSPAAPANWLSSVEAACDEALTELLRSRAVEGATVAAAIASLSVSLRARAAEVRKLASEWPSLAKQRLEARIADLLADRKGLDPGRIELEAAVAADRADVTEELSRLDAHLEELERLHTAIGPIGRRFEFLLQEIGRETNTLGAKAAAHRISSCVIDIKSDLDKLRELVANVE